MPDDVDVEVTEKQEHTKNDISAFIGKTTTMLAKKSAEHSDVDDRVSSSKKKELEAKSRSGGSSSHSMIDSMSFVEEKFGKIIFLVFSEMRGKNLYQNGVKIQNSNLKFRFLKNWVSGK